jgi:transposase
MAGPISNDLRERAVAAMMAGETARSVGARFGIATSSVIKWRQRLLATDSVAPAKMGGHRRAKLDVHGDLVLGLIETTPHLTLHKLVELLGQQGIKISHNGVWLFLRRRGLSFKKNTLRVGAKEA